LVSVKHLKPVVNLAKTIYDGCGQVLLAQGTVLNEYYLKRLKDLGIRSIYIDDGVANHLEVEDVVSEATRLQLVQIVQDTLKKVKAGNSFESRRIREAVKDIIDEILNHPEVIIHLTDIRSLRDHTFGHSANVCILSLLTGLALDYNQSKLKELGIGALLHDVGKAIVPENIVNSKKIFTAKEYGIIQKHAGFGFDILRNNRDVSNIVANIAWQHHERFNGSGYPRGLSGKDILEFARIVAIADVYDALATDRPYRSRLMPHEVVEIIRAGQGREFDPEIATEFIRNIAPFPKGSIVLLNTGQKGIIWSVLKDFPTRPKVRLLYDKKGNRIEGEKFVDLMQELTVFVIDVIRD
jgi:HD-GYP domain-containing protein (c-di-GMP phosphodiesterase class II)